MAAAAATKSFRTTVKHLLAASSNCQILEHIGLYRYSHSFSRSGDFTASKRKLLEFLESLLNSRTKMKNTVEAKKNEGCFKTLAAHYSGREDMWFFFFVCLLVFWRGFCPCSERFDLDFLPK